MKAITKAIVVAMLAFITLVPAMAFVPTIPASVETTGIGLTGADAQITSDNAAYTYQRIVADAAGNFQPQNAFSGVIFGANQETTETDNDYTAGVLGQDITTTATNPVGITRQYIAQGGQASVNVMPASPADVSHPTVTPVVTASDSMSNLAWMEGDMTQYSATPTSFATVGGNYMDPALDGGVSSCGNIWLQQTQVADPITVTANNGATMDTAYAGTSSTESLAAYPDNGLTGSFNRPAEVLMSGYADRFAGYTADVPADGSITLDLGVCDPNKGGANSDPSVTQSWSHNAGVWDGGNFNNLVPTATNFVNDPGLGISWPDLN
jgi:hypothetical protein